MNCIYSHKKHWKCLQVHATYEQTELDVSIPPKNLHVVKQKFLGSNEPRPERFETRNCYPVQSSELLKKISERLLNLKLTTNLSSPPNRVCYVYDSQMAEHRNLFEE